MTADGFGRERQGACLERWEEVAPARSPPEPPGCPTLGDRYPASFPLGAPFSASASGAGASGDPAPSRSAPTPATVAMVAAAAVAARLAASKVAASGAVATDAVAVASDGAGSAAVPPAGGGALPSIGGCPGGGATSA